MQKIIFLCLTLLLLATILTCYGQPNNYIEYRNSRVEEDKDYKKGNAYQRDYLLFIDLLKTTHPAFAQDFPLNLDSLKEIGLQQLRQNENSKELYRQIQRISSQLHDGHTGALPDFNQNELFPFVIFIDGKDVYLRAVDAQYKDFLGKKIIRINGHTITDAIEVFCPLISSDNDIYFKKNVCNYMQLRDCWCLVDDSFTQDYLTLDFADQTSLKLETISKKALNMVWQQSAEAMNTPRTNSKEPFLYTIIPEKSICYLQFNNCTDRNSLRYQIENSATTGLNSSVADQYPRFDNFLLYMFDEMDEEGIEVLVVDVRNNKGGNSSLCSQLLSYLAFTDSIQTCQSVIRCSNFWALNYPGLAETYKKSGFTTSSNEGELHHGYEFPDSSPKRANGGDYFVMNRDSSRIFKGKVVFIQNANTFSSAGMLITEAIDNGIGTVIGDYSSYRPCNYGDVLLWQLPNTGMKGSISHKIFNRPDASKCDEDHITPHIYIPGRWEDILQGKDACWDWIISQRK